MKRSNSLPSEKKVLLLSLSCRYPCFYLHRKCIRSRGTYNRRAIARKLVPKTVQRFLPRFSVTFDRRDERGSTRLTPSVSENRYRSFAFSMSTERTFRVQEANGCNYSSTVPITRSKSFSVDPCEAPTSSRKASSGQFSGEHDGRDQDYAKQGVASARVSCA